MPFRRFHIDTLATPQTIIARLRAEVRQEPDFAESFRELWKSKKPEGPVFIGKIDGRTFRIRQVVRGRNSFIPLIRGRIEPIQSGTRIDITMFMHPFVFTFMLFWLGACAWGIWVNPRELPLLIMFVFGATLSIGSFYWEAAEAERLLSRTVADSASSGHQNQTA
jgi:hypothetical protein